MRFPLPWLLLLTLPASLLAAGSPPDEKRIVFLGDSITQAGDYIAIIEAALTARNPDNSYQIIPLGLSSETVSGLSEEGHADGKFPRPDLHERLGRILTKAKPQLIVACYGMNDGIYHPPDPARTRSFQDGMTRLHRGATAAGARIIHLTPPTFDPLPIKNQVLGDGLEKYPKPWQGYNTVLDEYSRWLVSQRGTGWEVLDLHTAMNTALTAARTGDPSFTFSQDGVHPGPAGHRLIAQPLLEAWGLEAAPDGTPIHPRGPAILSAIRKKQAVLKPAWLTHTGHLRPGIGAGLPLEEAEARAAFYEVEARRLARLPTGGTSPPPLDFPGKLSK